MPKMRVAAGLLLLLGMTTGAPAQDEDVSDKKPEAQAPRQVTWKEGVTIDVLVPLTRKDKKRMTTIKTPEEGIENAFTGLTDEVLISVRGGHVFLRMVTPAEGEITLIGSSGRAYLLSIKPAKGDQYDSFLRILGPQPTELPASTKKRRGKPVGALGLMRAMRLGARVEGVRVLAADREIILRSDNLEVRLLFVYLLSPYTGRVYEIRNKTDTRLSIDASKLRPDMESGEKLIASGLKENLLRGGETTLLFMVFWSESK